MDGDKYTLDDVCVRKHRGNKESREANPSAKTKIRMRQYVLHYLKPKPQTSKELAQMMMKPLNAISGRISELKAMGLIEPTGERRRKCAVLRVKK